MFIFLGSISNTLGVFSLSKSLNSLKTEAKISLASIRANRLPKIQKIQHIQGAALRYPPSQPKLEASARSYKWGFEIHLLNINYAKNFDSHPTFCVHYLRLHKILQMKQKYKFRVKTAE